MAEKEVGTLAFALVCAECRRDDDGRRGWRMRLTVDDELVAFCPECDQREFG